MRCHTFFTCSRICGEIVKNSRYECHFFIWMLITDHVGAGIAQ
jgi:hypothetical protein